MTASSYERELKGILSGREDVLSKVTKTCSDDVSHNDLVNLFRFDSCAIDCFFHDNGTELRCFKSFQCAVRIPTGRFQGTMEPSCVALSPFNVP